MNIEYINPSGVSKPKGFTHTIRISDIKNLLIISGQVAKNSQGEVIGKNDLSKQLIQVFKNIEANLKAAGVSFKDVVKMNIYTVDMPAFRKALTENWNDLPIANLNNAPCQTWIEVKGLARPTYLIEIDAIAIKH